MRAIFSPLFQVFSHHLLFTGNGVKFMDRVMGTALRTPSQAYRSASMT
jgi:hypothetical protein